MPSAANLMQKRLYKRLHANAFALAGRTSSLHHTQGDALGYVLVAPSGRALNACFPLGRSLRLGIFVAKDV